MLPKSQDDLERPKQRSWRTRSIVLNGALALFSGLAFCRFLQLGGFHSAGYAHAADDPVKPPPMDVFQVYPPVRVGQDYLPALEERRSECNVVLMEHVFGWSYGQPFVGKLHLGTAVRDGVLNNTLFACARDLCSPGMRVDERALQSDHDLYRPPV